MSCPPKILDKIRLLRNLINSSNENESAAARATMDSLIEKYQVTEAELQATEELPPAYGEEEKIFSTIGVVGWKQILVLAIANYFDCQVVQEYMVAAEGEVEYSYYGFGDDDQIKDTQFVYRAFTKKIDNLIVGRCFQRGPIYIDSYCEGLVESIKWNIQMYGIEIPEIKKKLIKQEEQAAPPTTHTLATVGKEEPTENRVNVNAGSLIKDIQAYFRGIDDGKNLSLQDILELEVTNKESAELPR